MASRGTFGLIGAGAVGPAVARRLSLAGYDLETVASRRIESARAAVEFIGSGVATTDNALAAEGVDLLVIAVPDGAVITVARELAARSTLRSGSLALHLSGALSSEALSPLRDAGASVGSVHPLQTFADYRSATERISRSFLFYEGDDPPRIRRVAEALGGRPVPIRAEDKTLYHAGAAAACNLAIVMIDLGVRLFGGAGIGPEEALDALKPLISGTLSNLDAVGLPAALTGPVARGDVLTVAKHAEAIRARFPDLWPAYREGSRHAIRLGLSKGTLSESSARRILEILTPPEGD